MTELGPEPLQSQEPERPADAVLRETRPSSPRDRDDREALELREIQTQEDHELDYSSPSASSGEEYRVTRRTTSRRSVRRPGVERKGTWHKICRFWTHHVTLTVPQKSNRDHFALERTFLAYIRTSVVIAMQGVLIAQLFRLQRSPTSEDRLRFYEVGIPLSVTCHCVAVVVALIGAYRFWRQQSAISRGKIHVGGWELNWVGILLFSIILVTLVISVAIIIEIEMDPATLIQRILRR
ncbi:hypothetical protein N7448_007219 [Penicillium atrosanguineum]|uniref:DUF202 domain-containing protein n=1 Tax=Penicillium atrosanguineum TaxID=1132637 RepID=A0A9W9PTF8_9EURO|nr:uncharacterized protein N7443_010983 [Penicillium atrosanguineum]KAJ5133061.1 hypothetical protein N7448_007219 [Penicillium atrosanguineum]KAJ5141045.1 hypothetical protein N7526_002040 [Penicillium atrosanguineum]KAJ5290730.1 hypothetical protein N7443_010983 [Penicillium atrosanguineum]KAJ5308551.1 hypothetical protein N7476_009207 [Penicillium atrosanguineum]